MDSLLFRNIQMTYFHMLGSFWFVSHFWRTLHNAPEISVPVIQALTHHLQFDGQIKYQHGKRGQILGLFALSVIQLSCLLSHY